LPTMRRVLGPEHPLTLKTTCSLASSVFEADNGRSAEAKVMLLDALKVQERVYGRENPDTLDTARALAMLSESTTQSHPASPASARKESAQSHSASPISARKDSADTAEAAGAAVAGSQDVNE
jgi:hypothetical protein